MESKLKVSEEKYRYLFEGLTDAIFITFTDYKFQDFNPAMLELFGYNTEEMEIKVFWIYLQIPVSLRNFKMK